jgi:hypothetical protein
LQEPFTSLNSWTYKVGIDRGFSLAYNIGWDALTYINALTGEYAGWGGSSSTQLLEIEVW